MGRGFNIPWVLVGWGLAWATADAMAAKWWLVLYDLSIAMLGYAIAERRRLHH
jgi:hypothetical protein